MANPDSAFGLVPVSGGPAGMQTPSNDYAFDATEGKFGINQPVRKKADNKIERAPANATGLVGSVVAIEYIDADGTPRRVSVYPGNVSGATNLVAKVADDVYQRFVIQSDGTGAEANIGKNAGITGPSTDDSKKSSTVELDQSSVATTNTLPLKIVGKVSAPKAGSEFGANTRFEVTINNHQNAANTAGV